MIQIAVAAFLGDRLGEELIAAFIYGSVATGRAGPGSDIDCFVITANDLPATQHRRLAGEFSALQRELGHTPDPEYPIEVFSLGACQSLLAGQTITQALRDAAAGPLAPAVAASDEVEILRALLDRRLILHDDGALDLLTSRANALLHAAPGTSATIRAALGLTEQAAR